MRSRKGQEMGNVLRSVQLENGLLVEFFDRSNRYFGDYHRLCVEARCHVPLNLECFAGSVDPVAELQAAKTVLGNEVVFARTLEKMGVAGEAVERAREVLVDSFIRSSLPYLDTPTFPRMFVGAELARCRQGRRPPWPRL
jgi:hypothetical protein